MNPARSIWTFALVLLVGWSATPALAEQQTVSVTAVGEFKVRPDTVEITGLISESNEKMKDAVAAFNDTRRRALASINAEGIENLQIEASSLSLSIAGETQQFDPFGNEVEKPIPKGSLTISQSVTLKVTGLDQMEEAAVVDMVVKLIGAAREAGVDLTAMSAQDMMRMEWGMGYGSAGTAVFSLSDPESVRKSATKDAVDKARADAAFLAELAGGKLGPVVAIGDGSSEESINPYMFYGYGMMEEDLGEFATPALEPIVVRRPLMVSFRLITE
ncbi:MAG: SIMPL domain-containing protein [Phycisphaeraceae bacterium]